MYRSTVTLATAREPKICATVLNLRVPSTLLGLCGTDEPLSREAEASEPGLRLIRVALISPPSLVIFGEK